MIDLFEVLNRLKVEFIETFKEDENKVNEINKKYNSICKKRDEINKNKNSVPCINKIYRDLFIGNEGVDYNSIQVPSKSLDGTKKIFEFMQTVERNLSYYSTMSEDNKRKLYEQVIDFLNTVNEELERLSYLILLDNKNVVLIGANGSGKSSFANFLKKSVASSLIVVPAQKYLVVNKDSIDTLKFTKSDVNKEQRENFYEVANEWYGHNYQLINYFTGLVNAFCNEYILSLGKEAEKNNILEELNIFMEYVLPHLKFDVDRVERTLLVSNLNCDKNEKYNIKNLSDGEKTSLYYALITLLAPDNSVIIIDEPETFLNLSISNKVWDYLERVRRDCKYIYISHNIDFILSRVNADIYWMKGYTYPNKWSIDRILNINENSLPLELVVSILGSAKPVIFCEGTKSSHDVKVYNILFGNKATIYPVGGHQDVKKFTQVYNGSKFFNKKAIGIIDRDLKGDDEEAHYKENNIYLLPFYEIEMFLLEERIIKELLTNIYSIDDAEKHFDKFLEAFFERVNNKKNKICSEKIRAYINSRLSNHGVNNCDTLKTATDEIKNLMNEVYESNFDSLFLSELEDACNKKDYLELLKLVSLKDEIAVGLADRYLVKGYLEKAIRRLELNIELRNQIITEYFPEIEL